MHVQREVNQLKKHRFARVCISSDESQKGTIAIQRSVENEKGATAIDFV